MENTIEVTMLEGSIGSLKKKAGKLQRKLKGAESWKAELQQINSKVSELEKQLAALKPEKKGK